MKIVLATGIYPPEIGGPATYVKKLATELVKRGHEVCVICYGKGVTEDACPVTRVPRLGGPLLRWWRYSRVLKKEAHTADVVYAFSSVSAGVPIALARIKHAKLYLRLGGDFFWERYTDRGGKLSLSDWYQGHPLSKRCMQWLLNHFHTIVFSTDFEKKIYENAYAKLPTLRVIENALPVGAPTLHVAHNPFQLLFLGRLVQFKSLDTLFKALVKLPNAHLTIIGSGPAQRQWQKLAEQLLLQNRVTWLPPQQGQHKQEAFAKADALIIPSITEISPNTALEARAAGLPVILTEKTGLSSQLTSGMNVVSLKNPIEISKAISMMIADYETFAAAAATTAPTRGYSELTNDHEQLWLG